jgi:thioredoxin 1
MNSIWKILIVVALIIAVAAVVNLKNRQVDNSGAIVIEGPVNIVAEKTEAKESESAEVETVESLPLLRDIGSTTCIPCKMMAPILEELKSEYAGVFDVDFLDVQTNPAIAKDFGITLIPTQIFYDASGTERFRHVGFFSKEDILNKWKELGVDLSDVTGDMEAFERLVPAKVDDRPGQVN